MADRAAQQRFLVPFFREHDSRVELQEVEPGRLQAIATQSSRGGANPGRFADKDREELAMTLRLSALAHAELALHFGRKLAKRDWRPSVRRSHGCRHGRSVHGT